MENEKVTHECGATSSKLDGYDQLPYHAMKRLAARFKIGEDKHGRDNWRKGLGDKAYVVERLGHVIHHALKAIAIIEGHVADDGDDNAGAIMWGGAFLAEALEGNFVTKSKALPELCPTCGTYGYPIGSCLCEGRKQVAKHVPGCASFSGLTCDCLTVHGIQLSLDTLRSNNAQYCTRGALHDGPCNGYPTKSCGEEI